MGSVVRRPLLAVLLGATLLGPACNNNNSSSTSNPTTPSSFLTTDTFTGTLMRNGAASYSFTVSSAGTVTVTLNAVADTVDPNAPAPNVGISLGTWDGASCSVQTGIFSDTASVGASISGTVTGAGVLCARIYDPASFVGNPLAYTLTVTHP
jgi:hypothetical protein